MRSYCCVRSLAAAFLACLVAPLYALNLNIGTNQDALAYGETLSLSLRTNPNSSEAGMLSDQYIAAILPDGSLFTLSNDLTWTSAIRPVFAARPLTVSDKTTVYSLRIPESLPSGKYTFYLVVVPAGADPLINSNWIGYDMNPVIVRSAQPIGNANPIIGNSVTISTSFTRDELGRLNGAISTLRATISDPDGDTVSCTWEGTEYPYSNGYFSSPARITGDCSVAQFQRTISFGQASQADITLTAYDTKGGISIYKYKFR